MPKIGIEEDVSGLSFFISQSYIYQIQNCQYQHEVFFELQKRNDTRYSTSEYGVSTMGSLWQLASIAVIEFPIGTPGPYRSLGASLTFTLRQSQSGSWD